MGNRTERRTRWWWGTLLGLAALAPSIAAEPEDELKSATVLTFIRHAEWQAAASGPIRVAVLGRPAMVRTLRRNLEGRTANNRAVQIVEVDAQSDLRNCQVLYLATGSPAEIRQSLAAGRARHSLTIGESDYFLESGGAVNLLIVDGHMSFEVSREALARAGVTISAKLLRYGQVNATHAHSGRPPA